MRNSVSLQYLPLFSMQFVEHIADGILVQARLKRTDVPIALHGLKAAGKAMPLIKNFVHNFTTALDVQEDLVQLNSKKGNIDLFDCK